MDVNKKENERGVGAGVLIILGLTQWGLIGWLECRDVPQFLCAIRPSVLGGETLGSQKCCKCSIIPHSFLR